jgi:hypothetical protein
VGWDGCLDFKFIFRYITSVNDTFQGTEREFFSLMKRDYNLFAYSWIAPLLVTAALRYENKTHRRTDINKDGERKKEALFILPLFRRDYFLDSLE